MVMSMIYGVRGWLNRDRPARKALVVERPFFPEQLNRGPVVNQIQTQLSRDATSQGEERLKVP
jgi:hypothetical protein